MTGEKLVSVIIPVYNVEEFLVKCIDSVRAQTYKRLEVILVDDGSTDRSSVLCDCFSVIDQRIQVIHKENGGLSSARNAGLDMASGEYIYFLDSDDYIEPQLIEKTVETIEQTDSDWCGFRAVKEDVEGRMLYQLTFQEGIYRVKNEEERVKFLLSTFLNYKIGWEAWIHVYKRSIIEKNNLRFVNERLVYAEDLLFSFCYLLNINSAVVLPENFYHYVERKDSLMGKNKSRNVLPMIHRLAKEAFETVCKSENTFIKENFHLIYLSLIEWHIRAYITELGIDWVKEQMYKISWQEFVPEGYFVSKYTEDMRRYAAQCGIISVIIPVRNSEEKELAERFIKHILHQSIQRLELILIEETGMITERLDCRIRCVHAEELDSNRCFRMGFKTAFGEYVYFPNIKQLPEVDFLRSLSDAMKYNQCDVGVVCEDMRSTEVYDSSVFEERKKIRAVLKKAGIDEHWILFRKDLLLKSGLYNMTDLKRYEENMILSGRVIFLKKDKQL